MMVAISTAARRTPSHTHADNQLAELVGVEARGPTDTFHGRCGPAIDGINPNLQIRNQVKAAQQRIAIAEHKGVGARATGEEVLAAQARQDIVAPIAAQAIGPFVTGYDIGILGSFDIGEVFHREGGGAHKGQARDR